jgi:hypothetical protein
MTIGRPDTPLQITEVLDAEDRALSATEFRDPTADRQNGATVPEWSELIQRLHGRKRAALCFSGGGIRSASFGLGVLQALASRSEDPAGATRPRLLGEIAYLSTVSGGGYLGAWFSGWATRLSKPSSSALRIPARTAEAQDGPGRAIRALASSSARRPFDPDIPEVRHLREYTNYLTPQLGLLSGDTWAVVGSVVRNVVLNWLVLLPITAALLMQPLVAQHVATASVTSIPLLYALLLVSVLLGGLATAYIGFDLPSAGNAKLGYAGHLWFCLIPLTLSAIGLNVLWAWMPAGNASSAGWRLVELGQRGLTWRHFGALGALMFGGGMLAGIAASMFAFKRPAPKTGLVATLAAIFTGFIGGLTASRFALMAEHVTGRLDEARAIPYTIAAFSIVIGVFLLAASLLVGATSYVTEDKDREWWSRSGGSLFALAIAWPILAAIVLALPPLLVTRLKTKLTIHGMTVVAGWAVSQLAGSASTPAAADGAAHPAAKSPGAALKTWGAALLLPVFLVLLCASLAIVNTSLHGYLKVARAWAVPSLHASVLHDTAFASLEPVFAAAGDALLLTALYIAVAMVASAFINVNSFSLHGMYKQRLIRAYLGGSNDKRSPNRFTGFDEADDMPMAALTSHRPLHVINMALNLVRGSNLAWQERKAESFTVTRLHSGSGRVGYRPSDYYGGRYRDRPIAKQPISLGTAMTISGAAASPNMGYNSSPMLGVVMTLFNARLGWWLGNPASTGRIWKLPGPRVGIKPFLAEAFGLTDDRSNWIYLSDGGHFENLGVYEMVLRRCALIIVSDAGADPSYAYEDLGNAVRKIRIDLGIPIEFDRMPPMAPTKAAAPSNALAPGHHCAIGRIRYDCIDPGAAAGTLIYLKPSLTGDEPTDVLHYSSTDPTFPHQTTVDQFFSEAQFESYRRLGVHIVDRICDVGKTASSAPDVMDLAEFVRRAIHYSASATP